MRRNRQSLPGPADGSGACRRSSPWTAPLLGGDHRAGILLGAGPVLGRHRLHLHHGAGTAITVAAIASIAVGAKAWARRIAGTSSSYGTLALRAIEVAAAAVIIAFGALLLTGYMASERMIGV